MKNMLLPSKSDWILCLGNAIFINKIACLSLQKCPNLFMMLVSKELCQEDEALLGDKMKCYVNQKWYFLLFMLAIYQDMQHRNKYHPIV